MTPSVDIAGVAEFPQGRTEWPSTMALHEALVLAALDDAGRGRGDVEALFTVAPRSDSYLIHAAAVAERLRINPEHCWTYEAGGAAPVIMLQAACSLVATGRAKCAVVVAADLPLTGVGRSNYVSNLAAAGPVHPEFEVAAAPTVPSMFGLVARRYLDDHQLADDALFSIVRHDRAMAADHPNAHMRKPLSEEDYQAARPIADPLCILDCAPVSDGGGAVVVAADGGTAGRPAIRLLGSGTAMTHLHLSAAPGLTGGASATALERALTRAEIDRDDIDLALLYDCFSIAMALAVEEMGFAAPGRAAEAFAEGRFARGGQLPINTHGGLLSHGHPARAGGMGNLVEAIVQLRGEAGARQVGDCAVALVHGMGGIFATHGVALLSRDDR